MPQIIVTACTTKKTTVTMKTKKTTVTVKTKKKKKKKKKKIWDGKQKEICDMALIPFICITTTLVDY